MAAYADPRPSSAYDFAGAADPELASAQETAWIEVIRKMEEVYSKATRFLVVSRRQHKQAFLRNFPSIMSLDVSR